MADKFYMMLLTNGEALFGEQKNDEIIDYILQYEWVNVSNSQFLDRT